MFLLIAATSRVTRTDVLAVAAALGLPLAEDLVRAVGEGGLAVLHLAHLAVELADILAEAGDAWQTRRRRPTMTSAQLCAHPASMDQSCFSACSSSPSTLCSRAFVSRSSFSSHSTGPSGS